MREKACGGLRGAAAGKELPHAAALAILCLAVFGSYGFSPAQLDQVKETNRCEACDLSGADLAKAVMNDARLSRAGLAGARMSGVVCEGERYRIK